MLFYRNPLLLQEDEHFRYLVGSILGCIAALILYYYMKATGVNNKSNSVLNRALQWKHATDSSPAAYDDIERGGLGGDAGGSRARQELLCYNSTTCTREIASEEDIDRYIHQLTVELKRTRVELLYLLVATNSPLVSTSPTPSPNSTVSSISNDSIGNTTPSPSTRVRVSAPIGDQRISVSRFSPSSMHSRANHRGSQYHSSDDGSEGFQPPTSIQSITSMMSGANAQLITQCLENPLSGDTYDEDDLWDHNITEDMHELQKL